MQRFVPVGRSRLHFIGAVIHDPGSVDAVLKSLKTLQPQVIELGLSVDLWDRLHDQPGHLDRLERVIYDQLLQRWRAEPNAVWRAVLDWSSLEAVSARPALPRPAARLPKGRKGVKGLENMIRREGFDAPTPRHALHKLHALYVARLPKLRQVLWDDYRAMAHALVRRYQGNASRVVVILPHPLADAVADLVLREAQSVPRAASTYS